MADAFLTRLVPDLILRGDCTAGRGTPLAAVGGMWSQLLRPFRFQPLYTLACSVTIALAVAAAVASFAVVQRALLDPLPYADGERLVTLETSSANRRGSVSAFVFDDLKRSAPPAFSDLAQLRYTSPTYQSTDSAQTLQAQEVTAAFFTTFGVRPALGAVWAATDSTAAIVSWNFWQRSLSGDPNVLGRTITLDGTPRQVVGVMAQGFLAPFGPQVDLWLPLDMRPLLADPARARRTISVYGRLASGASLEQARAYMSAFSERQRAQHPAIHGNESWLVTPLRDNLVGPARPALLGTAAAALLLVVIVWANIAGLSAVNAAAMRHRFAIRAALGASSGRLFREELSDSLTIATTGSIAGLWLGSLLIDAAARYQAQFLPMLAPVSFDWGTALAGLALGMVTGVVASLAPYGAVRRLQSGDPMRSARALTGDRRLARVRAGLVFAQVAVAVVLIVGAGLLVRTVATLSATSMGFETSQFTSFHVTLPMPAYRATERQIQFERQLRDRVAQIPGVAGVSASVGFPVMGTMGARLTILDRPDQDAPPEIGYASVTPGYHGFLGVRILEGRDIADTDDFPAPRVVVINETMARTFWPEGNAIGARVKIGAGAPSDREIIVVGVAADVRQNGPTQDVRPIAFGSTLQYSWPRRHIAVKADARLAGLAEQLRAAVHAVDPAVATTTPAPVDSAVAQQTARHRLVMLTLTLFGAVATLLCGMGLYATVALSSRFRRREYAIRVALGSSRSRVCWLVLRQSLVLAFGGALAGLAAAAGGTQVLGGLLHGVTPLDRVTFVAAFAGIVMLAALSAALPAVRAGHVNPADTLKVE